MDCISVFQVLFPTCYNNSFSNLLKIFFGKPSLVPNSFFVSYSICFSDVCNEPIPGAAYSINNIVYMDFDNGGKFKMIFDNPTQGIVEIFAPTFTGNFPFIKIDVYENSCYNKLDCCC